MALSGRVCFLLVTLLLTIHFIQSVKVVKPEIGKDPEDDQGAVATAADGFRPLPNTTTAAPVHTSTNRPHPSNGAGNIAGFGPTMLLSAVCAIAYTLVR